MERTAASRIPIGFVLAVLTGPLLACGPRHLPEMDRRPHPALEESGVVELSCTPPSEDGGCAAVAVFIAAPPEHLWSLLTDLDGMSTYFPGYSFRKDGDGPLVTGDTYEARRRGARDWERWRVIEQDAGARQLLAWDDSRLPGFVAEHQFLPVPGGAVSQEVAHCRHPERGLESNAALVHDAVVRTLRAAHRRLRRVAEGTAGGAP